MTNKYLIIKLKSSTPAAPTFTSSPDLEATADTLYEYQAAATGGVGSYTWSLVTYPTGMEINAVTGLVTWTPTEAQEGVHSVTVRVTDETPASRDQSFNINVAVSAPSNTPPTITNFNPSSVAYVDEEYTYQCTAYDPDPGDVLTWSLTQFPTGMEINSATGLITWTPTETGAVNVTVRVTDLEGDFDEESYSIIVPIEYQEENLEIIENHEYAEIASNAVANGSRTLFGVSLTVADLVIPGSVEVVAGSQIITDNGDGTMSGDGTGTVNYTLGSVSCTFDTPPLTGTPVTMHHRYNSVAVRRTRGDSATIRWHTTIRGTSQIEYGLTNSYGSETVLNAGLNSVEHLTVTHAQDITGLDPNTTYHYRVKSTANGVTAVSADYTFTTRASAPTAISVAGGEFASAYLLNTAGATYTIQDDVVAGGSAFRFTANDITLDLNGKTITYAVANGVIVPNAGFEEVDGEGDLIGWDLTNAPNADREAGDYHLQTLWTGQHALVFRGADGSANEQSVISASPVILQPGRYQFGIMRYGSLVQKTLELVDEFGVTLVDADGFALRHQDTRSADNSGRPHITISRESFRFTSETQAWMKITVQGMNLLGNTAVFDAAYIAPSLYYGVESDHAVRGSRVMNGTVNQDTSTGGFRCHAIGGTAVDVWDIDSFTCGTESSFVGGSWRRQQDIRRGNHVNDGSHCVDRHSFSCTAIGSPSDTGYNFVYATSSEGCLGSAVFMRRMHNEVCYCDLTQNSKQTNNSIIAMYGYRNWIHNNHLYGDTTWGAVLITVNALSRVVENNIEIGIVPNQEYATVFTAEGKGIEQRYGTPGKPNIIANNTVVANPNLGRCHGIALREAGVVTRIFGNDITTGTNLTFTSWGKVAAAFRFYGMGGTGVPDIIVSDNIFRSNSAIIFATECRDDQIESVFRNNTFVKLTPVAPLGFRTFSFYGMASSRFEHVSIYDTVLQDEAYLYGAIGAFGTVLNNVEYFFGWQCTIEVKDEVEQPIIGATITIRDSSDTIVATVTTDDNGEAVASDILEAILTAPSSWTPAYEYHTPHELTIEAAGYVTQVVPVTVDATKTVTITMVAV
jgi:hypothetical protein